MRVREFGWSALLIECGSAAEVEAWRAALWRARDEGRLPVTEIVPGAGTVLLDGVADPPGLSATLRGWPAPSPAPAGSAVPPAPAGSVVPPAPAPESAGCVEIPTVYDGEDLAIVARHWNVTPAEVVDRHRSTEFRVAFCGFAPGFGYLTGLPESLSVPRLATPRTRVPAGSVGLAGPYTGIYPVPSPGGWLLIGRTDVVLFDARAQPPALLTPGTAVRFVDIGSGR